MKRVAALYRVSTKQQVDITKNDIPMQRIACHKFADEHGWTIIIEKEEKGVSGYKVSAAKRDAIQELKTAAEKREFDVLLVFMFDRLGRIDSETPLILKWFTEQGIEVWSVNEGQQKMENNTDKLINYIRFWQAAGESEKTSIRVKTRLGQMTKEGTYTGGPVQLGYMLVDNGRQNKKGRSVRDLVINPEEAEIVRTLFRKVVSEGYGTHQLATYLNDLGLRTRHGALYQSATVLRILRSELYRGYLVRGDNRSERVGELQIVTDTDYMRAQQILDQRNLKNEEKRTVARSNRAQTLLGGNVYCAHCGYRLTSSRHMTKRIDANGFLKQDSSPVYICYHNSRKLAPCDGPTTYRAEKVDAMVDEIVRTILANVAGCPAEDVIREAYDRAVSQNKTDQKRLMSQIERNSRQLATLRREIANAITGDSEFSKEDLSEMISQIKQDNIEAEEQLAQLREEEINQKDKSDSIIPAYNQFRSWAAEYDDLSLEAKRMVMSELFDKIEIGRNYSIRYYVKIMYRQFVEDWVSVESMINPAG